MPHFVSSLLFLLFTSHCFAQQDTLFFDKKNEPCKRVEAYYYVFLTQEGDLKLATEYYLSNVKKAEYTCQSINPWYLEGRFSFWYENGAIRAQGNFHDNKRVDTWTWWYKHGRMKEQGVYKPDGTYQTVYPKPPKPDTLFDSHLMLKMAPLALIEPYSGTSLRLGTEFKLKQNLAGYIECGAYLPLAINGSQGNSGVTVKLEVKYYLNKKEMCGGDYYSLELFNKYQSYKTSDTIMISWPGYPRDYWVYKDITCLTFKFGHTRLWGKHFVMDAFAGAGVRYHYGVNGLSAQENQHIKSSSDYGPNVMENMAGSLWYPNIDVGIKIGYRLK